MSDSPGTEQRTATRGADGAGAFAGYSPEEDRPLVPYAVTTAVFAAAFGGSLVALERAGRPLPAAIAIQDVVLSGVATHKLSRRLTKDKVTSFVRAPFTRYQEPAGQGEVSERARGSGPRRVVGELLSCPYCIGQWVAGAFAVGLVAAPRPTRLVAAMYAGEALADFLQLAYLAAEKRT